MLVLLHHCVSSSPGPAGFEGRVTVCVCTREGPVSWVARFGVRPSSEIVFGAPDDVDFFWGLGELEADALLGRCPSPAAPFSVQAGDCSVLDSVSRRYLGTQTALTLRTAR